MLEKLDRNLLIATTLTIITVVAINFITSYQHIYDLGLKYGEFGVDARLMPVGIDGMLLALGFANVFAAKFVPLLKNKHVFGQRMLRLALAFGVAGTVAANGAYGASWGQTGALLGVWSPVALFIAVESGLFMYKIAAEYLADQAQADESPEESEAVAKLAEIRRKRAEASKASKARRLARERGEEPVTVPEQPVRHNGNVQNGQPPSVTDPFDIKPTPAVV